MPSPPLNSAAGSQRGGPRRKVNTTGRWEEKHSYWLIWTRPTEIIGQKSCHSPCSSKLRRLAATRHWPVSAVKTGTGVTGYLTSSTAQLCSICFSFTQSIFSYLMSEGAPRWKDLLIEVVGYILWFRLGNQSTRKSSELFSFNEGCWTHKVRTCIPLAVVKVNQYQYDSRGAVVGLHNTVDCFTNKVLWYWKINYQSLFDSLIVIFSVWLSIIFDKFCVTTGVA